MTISQEKAKYAIHDILIFEVGCLPSVYIKTLGCKVNAHDSFSLTSGFQKKGFGVAETASAADIAIINTCSVTENSNRESRYLVRRYRKDNPDCFIVATGCYAQTHSADLNAIPELDFIVPNAAKNSLVDLVLDKFDKRDNESNENASKIADGHELVHNNRQGQFKTSLDLIEASISQTRAYLKIQDGCNGFCSYCLIPYARGRSRSVDKEKVLSEMRRLLDIGLKEVVLTGIHIGDYGSDFEIGYTFKDLLEEILSLPNMVRVRISSFEPGELSYDLLQLMSRHKNMICDHFHLPLQSGNARILKLMRRSYTPAEYAEKISALREAFPVANIGADVIPGFPSETDEEFEDTKSFVERIGLNYLHVFPYSARPNTAAVKMPGHLPPETVKKRTRTLIEVSNTLKNAYAQTFIGHTFPVLWEKQIDARGRRIGKSPNYLDIVCGAKDQPEPNTISHVRLHGFVEGTRLLSSP
ncbi:MAG: tRNA (N(6)-L-threonylcarbamoyladenosine(37)-C(2))-methylthiotransferase MtaB [Oligoflexales bacterium]